VIQRVPDRPGVYYDPRLGYVRKVPGVVFFDEELIHSARALERRFFYEVEGKGSRTSKREPPLYSSFVMGSRLRTDEIVVVDRLRVTLSDPLGWAVEPDVVRWFGENARIEVAVNRRVLVEDFLRVLLADGYLLPSAHRVGGWAPRDPITPNDDITGCLTVLRDPGERPADAIVRVEAVGSWLVDARDR